MSGSIRTTGDHRRIRTISSLCALAVLCFCLSALLRIQSYGSGAGGVVEQGEIGAEEVISPARTPAKFTTARARKTFRTLLNAGRAPIDSTLLRSGLVIDLPCTACFSSTEVLSNFRSQIFIFSTPGRSPPRS